MIIGNFSARVGTGFDLGIAGFDSISGSDLEILYALDSDDVLNSAFTLAGGELPNGASTTILSGGSGNDEYQISNNSTAIIYEGLYSDDSNFLITTIGDNRSGIGLEKETSFVAQIENRHLYLGDTASNQYVIVLDWQNDGAIETFDLAEGQLHYDEFVHRYQDSSNYLGDLTWDEIEVSEEIDFDRLGLSPDAIRNLESGLLEDSLRLEIYSVYRFFNTDTGAYFYTSDTDERNFIHNNLFNYTYEGISYTGAEFQAFSAVVPPPEPSPADPVSVHRYLNTSTGTHFYTTDENEREFIDRELNNFSYEGTVFNAHNLQVEGSVPIYRFYNSDTNVHFYTPSTVEKDNVLDELPSFNYEGVGYYAFPIDSEEI